MEGSAPGQDSASLEGVRPLQEEKREEFVTLSPVMVSKELIIMYSSISRIMVTFSYTGSVNVLSVSNPHYFKPHKRSFQRLPDRPFGWMLKSWSYLLIPYAQAFGIHFPSQFSLMISFELLSSSGKEVMVKQGELLRLTDQACREEGLALNVGQKGLSVIHFSEAGTRRVDIPVSVETNTWTQLAFR